MRFKPTLDRLKIALDVLKEMVVVDEATAKIIKEQGEL